MPLLFYITILHDFLHLLHRRGMFEYKIKFEYDIKHDWKNGSNCRDFR